MVDDELVPQAPRSATPDVPEAPGFRLAIDSLPGLLCTNTAEGLVESVNETLLRYTGQPLEVLRNWQSVVHPDDLPQVATRWTHSVATGEPFDTDVRVRSADGDYRWFHCRGHASRDEQGRILRWYNLLTDIHERKQLEEKLRNLQAKLAQAARIAAVGELAAAIAHEVNQPLAAVVANAHACLRWLGADPPNVERALERAGRIVRDGKDAGEVVRRIRSLFKRGAANKVELDINELIEQVLGLLDAERQRKRVVLQTVLERGLPPIVGDPVQLQQLVLNLLLNGLEAMDGVEHKLLTVRSSLHNGGVILEVHDTGCGLSDPERAFEPFFTTKQDGLGMGLAICRSIAEAHGGRLWCVSSSRADTIFRFVLPLEPA